MHGPKLRSGRLEWKVSGGKMEWLGICSGCGIHFGCMLPGILRVPTWFKKSCSRGGLESSSKAFWRLKHDIV